MNTRLCAVCIMGRKRSETTSWQTRPTNGDSATALHGTSGQWKIHLIFSFLPVWFTSLFIVTLNWHDVDFWSCQMLWSIWGHSIVATHFEKNYALWKSVLYLGPAWTTLGPLWKFVMPIRSGAYCFCPVCLSVCLLSTLTFAITFEP